MSEYLYFPTPIKRLYPELFSNDCIAINVFPVMETSFYCWMTENFGEPYIQKSAIDVNKHWRWKYGVAVEKHRMGSFPIAFMICFSDEKDFIAFKLCWGHLNYLQSWPRETETDVW